jgi:hypothetical protein
MTRPSLPLLLLLATVAARPAQAREAREPGVSLGLRAGYAIPIGTFYDAPRPEYLINLYSGLLPVWVDAAYQFRSGLFVGAHAQYAQVQVHGPCPEELECGGRNVRLGVDVGWRFTTSTRWEPWLALGSGYEWSSFRLATEVGSSEQDYRGIEWLGLQVGVDYGLLDGFRLGPFAALTLGEYTHREVTLILDGTLVGTGSEALPRRSAHHWFFLGVRGHLDL